MQSDKPISLSAEMDHAAARQLRSVLSDMQRQTRDGDWENMDELAREQDRLLRILLQNPDPETVAYLETVREEHTRLLELMQKVRDELRAQLKHVTTGRRAVSAYR